MTNYYESLTLSNQNEYVSTCLKLLYHAHAYYELDSPEIEDFEYDRMYHAVRRYEESTGIDVPFSMTQIVGFDHRKLKYGE